MASGVKPGWDPAFEELTLQFEEYVSASPVSCDETALAYITAQIQLVQCFERSYVTSNAPQDWWRSSFIDDCCAGTGHDNADAAQTFEDIASLDNVPPNSDYLGMLCIALA